MEGLNIFDILIALSGVYLIYEAVRMKRTGDITGGVIVSKEVDVNNIRDKEGFIKYMFGKVFAMGILALIVGVVGMINSWLKGPVFLSLIGVLAYLAVLILFAVASVKARKKFIE